jgi:hypothetical protein
LFTKFDIRWGYNNVCIKDGDEWKAAFLTLEGLFEPTVMFFGLTNSLATFQMMMNTIFCQEVAQGWLSVYMDDIAIHTKPHPGKSNPKHREQHTALTHQILQKLHDNDLYLKPSKCEFTKDEIEYLGIIVGKNQMCMDPHKLDSVQQWKPPCNPTKVCQFLGFTGYYRYFIPNYSKIAHPLLDLTKKTELWHWGPTYSKRVPFLNLRPTCVPAPSSPSLTLRNVSTSKPTPLLMAWAPYSCRREKHCPP